MSFNEKNFLKKRSFTKILISKLMAKEIARKIFMVIVILIPYTAFLSPAFYGVNDFTVSLCVLGGLMSAIESILAGMILYDYLW